MAGLDTKYTAQQGQARRPAPPTPLTRPWVSVLTADGVTVGMPTAVLHVLLSDTFIWFGFTEDGEWKTELTAKTLVQLSEAFIVRAISRAEDAWRN